MELRSQTLAVDGAEIHYKSVGRGPAVLAIGGAGAGVLEFRRLGRRLAKEFQVISYDRRGTLESTGRTDRPLDFGQESGDIVSLLDALDVRQVIVFATCGGASAGFDFITRYPGYVRAYIVHEPITIRILPDVDEQRAFFQGLCRLNEREGPVAAYLAWTDSIGLDFEPTYGRRSLERAKRDGDFVFRHHIMEMVEFMPDLTAIQEAGTPYRGGRWRRQPVRQLPLRAYRPGPGGHPRLCAGNFSRPSSRLRRPARRLRQVAGSDHPRILPVSPHASRRVI